MQHYPQGDQFEREPLEPSYNHYDSPSRRPMHSANDYLQPEPPYYDASPRVHHHSGAHPDQNFDRIQAEEGYSRSSSPYSASGPYDRTRHHGGAPVPPQHGHNEYYNARGHETGYAHGPLSSNITPGAGNFSESASGGMAGVAFNVANRNPRESGMDALHGSSQLPPPPSRSQYPHMPQQAHSPQSSGGYGYDDRYGEESRSSLAGLGAAAASPGSGSPPHYGSSDPYDNPYQAFSSRNPGNHLGVVNPHEIADDGDDGLNYHRQSQRNSMLSLPHSDRSRGKQAIGATAAVGGAGGLMGRQGDDFAMNAGREKSSDWAEKKKSKKWKWVVIILVFLIIVGAIIGGVVGGVFRGGGSGSKDKEGQSAKEDEEKNGDLNINSAEIKELLNNPDLHKVFPGMDYTPLNTQYPDCLHNPPSQNNITRDVAVLSQLTNKIRLYGTDCNQTQMLIHAIDRLDMKDDIKIWLGVWQDDNKTTNARQLEQMWTILDDYGDEPFEGIIVANEILFREEMTETELANLMDSVRSNLTDKGLDLPVATSDLGDDWTSALAADSDYIMANIHPFFAGVDASEAASWTYSFWENQNSGFWKSDKKQNIISETGWPTSGGTNCGGASSCTGGSVAGIDELNTFMDDWVCAALKNGTQYFWFEAFDEPWKIRFNEKGKEWEDKWGLMDVNRNLKDGVKIPDCGGETVS